EIHDAKQVLEIKTRGVRTKADGVTRLVAAAGSAAQTAIFVGDDLTDLDGFRGLDEARAANPSLRTVKVAVGGHEAPAPLVDAADVVLEGEAAVPQLLAALLGR
ncbi:MAG: Trehalose-phosphatase, partial [Thermoleophilia bacterium]|nr:Trehalose-phosphatase [Thermoleophilia bacterium]